MFTEVLSSRQRKLLPLIGQFRRSFYLVGGTAIAFQVGHRRSLDFDLFTGQALRPAAIRRQIVAREQIERVLVDMVDELTVVVRGVRLSFVVYPFAVSSRVLDRLLPAMPDLPSLGAMKAYALGRRSKWKDYVDLFFLLRDHVTVPEITARCRKLYGHEFNEKNFRAQLGYFADVDRSEAVSFMPGKAVADAVIKRQLKRYRVQGLAL